MVKWYTRHLFDTNRIEEDCTNKTRVKKDVVKRSFVCVCVHGVREIRSLLSRTKMFNERFDGNYLCMCEMDVCLCMGVQCSQKAKPCKAGIERKCTGERASKHVHTHIAKLYENGVKCDPLHSFCKAHEAAFQRIDSLLRLLRSFNVNFSYSTLLTGWLYAHTYTQYIRCHRRLCYIINTYHANRRSVRRMHVTVWVCNVSVEYWTEEMNGGPTNGCSTNKMKFVRK